MKITEVVEALNKIITESRYKDGEEREAICQAVEYLEDYDMELSEAREY